MSIDRELLLVLDFGGQYNRLIARRVRDSGVYCEIVPYDISKSEIEKRNPKGIILTGGPAFVLDLDAPVVDKEIFLMGIPVLGICYGMQLMALQFGGSPAKGIDREYGKTSISLDTQNELFNNLLEDEVCWMSHTCHIKDIPGDFSVTASTKSCPVAAIADSKRKLYGVQFHPEVTHTVFGNELINNFLFGICGFKGDWKMESFIEETTEEIRRASNGENLLLGLSGGVDSSVAALLCHKAVGDRLTCIFVDHGLLRKNEAENVEKLFRNKYNINLICVDASDRFLKRLKGVSDPEQKRKTIGEEFIRVFEQEALKLGKAGYLVQGTIYPDVIESGFNKSATIKSHHNVGGLPDRIDFKGIIEPLRNLFKDEVRKTGIKLGLPEEMVNRQPFPGPGLAVRIIGEITREKLDILKECDHIFTSELEKCGLHKGISQYFAVLTDMRSVGVMGDERTYDHTVALRAVTTNDFMTCDWAKIPYDVLERVSEGIVNKVAGINRVVYDITTKPPATIEWE